MLLAASALLVPAITFAAEKIWTGASSDDWNTAANWSPASVPGASDSVVFDNNGTQACKLPNGQNPAAIGGLTFTAGYTYDFHFNGRTLTVNGNADLRTGGTVSVSGGDAIVFNIADGVSAQFKPRAGTTMPDIEKQGAGTLTISTNNLTAGAATLTAGTLNLGSDGLTHTVSTTATFNGGTLEFGDATLKVSGTVDLSLLDALTAGTGTLEFTGATTFTPLSGATHPAIVQNADAATTLSTNDLTCVSLTIPQGTFDIQALTLVAADSLGIIGGTLTATNGNLDIGGNVHLLSGTLTAPSGAFSAGGNWIRSGGTFNHSSGTVTFDATATGKTIATGGIPFNNVTFNGTGGGWTVSTDYLKAATLIVSNGSLDLGDEGLTDSVSSIATTGGSIDFGTSTVRVTTGDADFSGLSSLTAGTGALQFTGAGTQVFSPLSAATHPAISHTGSGTLQLASADLITNGFTQTAGILDFNGRNITTVNGGNFTIANGGAGTIAGLGGRTVTVAGDALLQGSCGQELNLDPGTAWILAAGGASSATFASLANCNASVSPGTATNCTDGGGNTNWSYDGAKFWTGAMGTNWNDAGNWCPAGLPGLGDSVVFSAYGTDNCVMDIDAAVKAIMFTDAYGYDFSFGGKALTVNGSADFRSAGAITADGGLLAFSVANAGDTAYIIPKQGATFPDIDKLGNGTVVVKTNGLFAGNLDIGAGIFDLGDEALSHSFTAITTSGGELDFGNATLLITASGDVDLSGLDGLSAGTGTLEFTGSDAVTFTPKAGVVHPNVKINKSGPGSVTMGNVALLAGDLNLADGMLYLGLTGLTHSFGAVGSVAGAELDFGMSTMKATGSVNLSNLATLTAGGGTLEFAGGGEQSFTPKAGATHPNITQSGTGTTTVQADLSAGALIITAGKFDLGDIGLTHSFTSISTTGGELDFGNSTLQITASGGVDLSSLTNLTAGTGTLEFTGSDAVTFTPKAGVTHPHIKVNKSGAGSVTMGGVALLAGDLLLADGVFDLGDNGLAHSFGAVNSVAGAELDFGTSTLKAIGNVDASNLAVLTAGTGTLEFTGTGVQSFTPKAGATHPDIKQSGPSHTTVQANLTAGALTITAGKFDLGDLGLTHSFTSIATSGGELDFGNAILGINTTGDVDMSNLTSLTLGTGTLAFTAESGVQNFTPMEGATHPRILHSGAATLRLSTYELICEGFSQTAGVLDFNGINITTVNGGDFTIYNGTATSIANLGGRTITVAGYASLEGSCGSELNLDPATGWSLNTVGALDASYASINNSTASGTAGTATNCTNGGSNSGWTFDNAKFWYGGASTSWNNADNWCPTGVPGAADSVIFSSVGNAGNCLLDIDATIKAVTFVAGFTQGFDFNGRTLTIAGNADFRSGGTITPNNGKIAFDVASGSANFIPKANTTHPHIDKLGGGAVVVKTNGVTAGDLTISAGIFDLGDEALSHSFTSITTMGGELDFGNATLQIQASGDVDLSNLTTLSSGSGTLEFVGDGASNFTPKAGTVHPDIKINKSGAGSVTIVTNSLLAGDLILADGLFDLGAGLTHEFVDVNSVAGAELDFTSSTIKATGNVDISNVSVLTPETGTLEFSGTGVQSFTPKASTTHPNITQSGVGATTVQGNLTAGDLLITGGTFHLGTGAFTHVFTAISTSGGTLDFGDATLQTSASGDVDLSGLTNVVPGTGWLEFTGSDAVTFTPKAGVTHPGIKVNKGDAGSVTIAIVALIAGDLSLADGLLDLGDNGLTHSFISVATTAGTELDLGTSTLKTTGNVDISYVTTLTIGAGTVEFGGTGTQLFTPKASVTNPNIKQSGTGATVVQANLAGSALTITAGKFDLGDIGLTHSFTSISTSGGGELDFGNSTLEFAVSGDCDMSGLTNITAGTGTLAFTAGSGTQTFTPLSGATYPAILHSGAGTLQLSTNNLTCAAFSQTAGVLDLNGVNVTTVNGGDFTVSNGTAASITAAGLAGRTITVAGDAVFTAGCGNELTLNPNSGWTIAVTGTLQVTFANIKNSTASVTGGIAHSCTDGGGNSGWTFNSLKVWSGSTTAWGTASNWCPSGVPGASDSVVFDGSSTTNCVLPTGGGSVSIKAITFASGYTGGFDFNNRVLALTSGADFRTGGTISLGTPGTSTELEFTIAAGQTRYFYPLPSGQPQPKLEKAGDGTLVVSGNALNLTATTAALTMTAGTLHFGNDGATHAVQSWSITAGIFDFGNSTVQTPAAVNLSNLTGITAGTGTLEFTNAGAQNFTPKTGAAHPTLKQSGSGTTTAAANISAGSLIITGGTFALGTGRTHAFASVSGTGTLAFGTSTLEVSGETVDFSGFADITNSSGTLIFTGTSMQVFTSHGAVTLPAITQSGAGGTVVWGNPLACGALTIANGMFDLGDDGLTHTAPSLAGTGGGIDFGTSTLKLTGNADLSALTSVSYGAGGTLELAGSAAQTLTPKAGAVHPVIKSNNSSAQGVVIATNALDAQRLELAQGKFDLGDAGLVHSITDLSITAGELDFGTSTLQAAGNVDLTNLTTLTPGTGILEFNASAAQTFTPKASQTHPAIKQNGAGGTVISTAALDVAGLNVVTGTFDLGDGGLTHTVASVTTSGGGIDFGTSTLQVFGDANLSGLAGITPSTGTLAFTKATGTQVFTPNASTTHPAVSHSGAGTLQLLTNTLNAKSFSNSAGVLDFNTVDITTVDGGNFTISNGTSSTIVGLSGRTITVAGDAALNGGGTALNLDPGAGWTISATGTLNADVATIANSNASVTSGVATNSTNSGGNTNWNFGSPPYVGYTADDVIPTAQISQSTDGTGVITIRFRAKDTDGATTVTLNTFEYSSNGGTSWSAPTNADVSASLSAGWTNNGGSNYAAATDWAGTVHEFTFNTRHADVSGFDGIDQSDARIRFKANDGSSNSINSGASENFRVDNLPPSVAAAVAITSGGGVVNAGDLSFDIDAGFTEASPESSWYGYSISSGYSFIDSVAGSGVADPPALTVGGFTALDGADSVVVRAWLRDIFGNQTLDTSSAYYVKPYTPIAPTVSNATAGSIDVAVNKHASETDGLYYAIQVDSVGSYWWVQGTGARGSDTIWNTVAGWGTKTVSGLAEETKYLFRTMSQNLYNATVLSNLSAADSVTTAISNTVPELFDTLGTTTTLQAAQRTDGSDTLDLYYQVLDAQQAFVTVSVQYRDSMSGAWVVLSDMFGDTGAVAADDSSEHRHVRWYLPALLVDHESDSIQIRVIADDGILQDTLTRAAADIVVDTKRPTVATPATISSGALLAGALSFDIDAGFTEGNPNTNTFSYILNGGTPVDCTGQSTVSDPAAKTVGVPALDGDDSVVVYVTHMDDFGHWVSDTSSAYYVKPYTPDTVSVSDITYSTIDVTVDTNAAEAAGLEYAVRVDSAGASLWLRDDGARTGSEFWQTAVLWNPTTVTGLTEGKTYVFLAKSRHKYNSAVESDLSVADSATVLVNQAPYATAVSISGTETVGEELTGNYTYNDLENDPQGTSTFKWYRSDDDAGLNKAAIAGATSQIYTLAAADDGKFITFEVTPVASSGTSPGSAVESGYTGAIGNAAPYATAVSITGTETVGQELTGNYTYNDLENDPQGASTFKWYRSNDGSGTGKAAIDGATAQAYTLVAADDGKFITFEVTPVASSGTSPGSAVESGYTGAIGNAAPYATAVSITGTETVGQELTGNYTYNDLENDPQGTSTYKWYRSDNNEGLNKAAIDGATAQTHTLAAADDGKFISFEVTPVASSGTTTGTPVESGYTGAIANSVPYATGVSITGTETVGQELTGNYTYNDLENDPQGTSTFKWYRSDDDAGLNKAAIAGATSITYTLVAADDGKYISFEVTPVASSGTSPGTSVESGYTGAIGNAAPYATAVSITGTETVGQELTGNYTYNDLENDPQGTSTFKWYRSDDDAGLNKAAIAGATSQTYTLAAADDGKYISFEVTPVASSGTSPGSAVESGYTGAIANSAPYVTGVSISGTETVGEELTGNYTYNDLENDPQGTSTFKWYRSDDGAGLNKSEIAGATAVTYTLVAADDGKFITFEVIPVASSGTSPGSAVESDYAGAIANSAPYATAVSITGTETVGEELTGNYTYNDLENDPQGTSTFKWYRSDDDAGLNKASIAGATAQTYTLAAADDGKYISFEVTPVASSGTSPGSAVESGYTGAIANSAPYATGVSISGTETVGQELTGIYTYNDLENDPQGTSTFKWYHSDDDAGLNKAAIDGATSQTYTLVAADDGKYISFEVTPVASSGTSPGSAVESDYTGAIANSAPYATAVSISGTETVGEELTGNYTYNDLENDPQGTSTYKWYRSDNNEGLNKAAIDGATAQTYTLVAADDGKYITFEVTPVAQTGTTTGTPVESDYTGAIANSVPYATAVSITGTETVGEELTGNYTYNDLENDPQGTSTFKWYRSDDDAGLNKAAIAGATAQTYTLVASDDGKYISFEVTPVASSGTSPGSAVESGYTGAIGNAAPYATAVSITGTETVGQELTGNYTYNDLENDPQGTSTFKWYRSDDDAGLNKAAIAGATSQTYTLVAADDGKYISFEVTPVASSGTSPGSAVESDYAGAIANSAPYATAVSITGTETVGEELTGNYTYNDLENDPQGTSTYKWYRSDNNEGLNKAAIDGATAQTYTLVAADDGKYISFEVTPIASSGTTTGTPVESGYTGAIANSVPYATAVSITGTETVGEELTGNYTYADLESDAEGTSTFKWYRSDNNEGLNKAAIDGATAQTYTLAAADDGKYISFEVTPVASSGTSPGIPVESGYTGMIGNMAPYATSVSISGIETVGEELRGNYTYNDLESDAEGGTTFKWNRSDNNEGLNKAAIDGATAQTYTLVAADDGKFISFEVTPVASSGTTTGTPVESDYTGAIANSAPYATAVSISGTETVGEELTGNYTYNDLENDPQGTSTYKWYRSDDDAGLNKTAIAGATSSTYTLVSADDGKFISFEVTPVASSGTTTGTPVESDYTGAIANSAPYATAVSISGTETVGEELTGNYTYNDLENDPQGTSTFKWYRSDDNSGTNKAEIAGATAVTYTLVAADDGKYISFEVTPVALSGTTTGTPVESGYTGAIANSAPYATAVSITGTETVGQELTGNYSYNDLESDPEGTSTFKWYRGDDGGGTGKAAIDGATAQTYTLAAADDGKYISFEVTPVASSGTSPGSAVESDYTGAIANSAPYATAVSITGTETVDQELTGNYTYNDLENDPQGTSTYKWYRSDDNSGTNKAEIAGATAQTYTLVAADDGKYLTFEVTPVASSGTSPGTPVESDYTGAIANAAPYATAVSITGTETVGEELTGNYTYNDLEGDEEGTSTFKWYRSDDGSGTGKAAIDGATAQAYTLAAADEGKFISFEVTPVASSGTSPGSAVESDYTGAIANAAPYATAVSITGTETVGQELTGNYTYNDLESDAEGVSTFKWYRSDNNEGLNKAAIDGATAQTYTLAAADDGKYISFEVTPVASSGTTTGTSIESGYTGAIANSAPYATAVSITGVDTVGNMLTGNYTYNDLENDPQGTSTYKWYRSDNDEGLNKTAISGATSRTYTLVTADEGRYISFEVTPIAASGTTTGAPVESDYTGSVAYPVPIDTTVIVAYLKISPETDVVSADSVVQFVGTAYDADSVEISGLTFEWSVVGDIGSIDASGLFAPSRVGSGRVVATCNAISDTSGPVTVEPGAASRLVVAGHVDTVSADSTLQLSAVVYDSDSNVVDAVITWEVLGGIGTISGTGFFNPVIGGAGRVVAALGTISDTTAFITVVPGDAAVLSVTPDTAMKLTVTDTVAFACAATDANGNAVSQARLYYSVSDTSVGAITSAGLFTATGFGTAYVVASLDGLADTSGLITVAGVLVEPNDTDTIVVSQNGVTLLIPPGTIDSAITVTIEKRIRVDTTQSGIDGYSAVYTIEPADLLLNSMIKVPIPIDSSTLTLEEAGKLRVFRMSVNDTTWDVVYGSSFDTSTGMVVGEVNQLGRFQVGIDTIVPQVSYDSIASVTAGGGIAISVDIDDNIPTTYATVSYRLGGETTWRDTTVKVVNGQLDLDFDSSMSSPRGFEYKVTVVDGSNETIAATRSVKVKADSMASGEPQPLMQWLQVSVPMQPVDNSFESLFAELGDYDPTRWKVFAYENGQFIEVMESDKRETAPGESYWLKLRDTEFTPSIGEATSVPTDHPFEITLEPGWNLISNPFMFDVSWNELRLLMDSLGISNDVVGPYYFDGESWRMPWPIGNLVALQTWKGYAVNNESDQPISFLVPARAYESGSAKLAAPPERDFWTIGVTATNSGVRSGMVSLGTHPDAENDHDRYDHLEPPPIESKVRVAMHRTWLGRRRSYLSDIRAPFVRGQRWEFSVDNAHGATTLHFDLDSRMGSSQVLLYDAKRQLAFDLRLNEEYAFIADSTEDRTFMLIVGELDYANQLVANVRVPQAFKVTQNFPNPFNEVTYFYYELPVAGKVDLQVYSMAGRKIADMVREYRESGYYRASWNGRDDKGEPVATGVYYYRFVVQDPGGRKVLFSKMRVMKLVR